MLNSFLFALAEAHTQIGSDVLRDLRLQLWGVGNVRLILLAPELRTAGYINQLSSQDNVIAVANQSSSKNRFHTQFMPDGMHIDLRLTIARNRAPSHHAQGAYL